MTLSFPNSVTLSFPNSVWGAHLPWKLSFRAHTGFVRSRYNINNPDSSHFITSTIVKWLPVFTTVARCEILVRSLTFCREHKSLKIYAWVILDNHFHAIVSGPELSRTIGDLEEVHCTADSGAIGTRKV